MSYIEFSAPMSRVGGLDYITLRDQQGKMVAATLLPLEADFWISERTRYTAFLDRGRVKRGILPNEQMGRAIHAGRRYPIVVDSTWRDANGLPLVATYRRSVHVVAPDEQIVNMNAWRLDAPARDAKSALVLSGTGARHPRIRGERSHRWRTTSTDSSRARGAFSVTANIPVGWSVYRTVRFAFVALLI